MFLHLILLPPLGSRSINISSFPALFSFILLEPSLLSTIHKVSPTQMFNSSHITTTSSPEIPEVYTHELYLITHSFFTAQLSHPPRCWLSLTCFFFLDMFTQKSSVLLKYKFRFLVLILMLFDYSVVLNIADNSPSFSFLFAFISVFPF